MGKVASSKSETVGKMPKACSDETAAFEMMEELRWGDTPACPRCGDTNVYQMKGRESGERGPRYLWRCRGCAKQYTVRVGTVMEDSPIPMRHWCYAFWAACASKKGVSALQIQRQTGLHYASALFLMHRIRFAMTDSSSGAPMSGDVEVDETYVGGKPRKLSRAQPSALRRNDGSIKKGPQPDFKDRKTPVAAIVERNGFARAFVPTDVTGDNLHAIMRNNISPNARLHTDEARIYWRIGQEFAGHHVVNHTSREYGRHDGDVHATTNTVESFFALVKRSIVGTFHNVSRKHLHRYIAEAEFKYNTRKLEDGERIRAAIRGGEGKRLTYRPLLG